METIGNIIGAIFITLLGIFLIEEIRKAFRKTIDILDAIKQDQHRIVEILSDTSNDKKFNPDFPYYSAESVNKVVCNIEYLDEKFAKKYDEYDLYLKSHRKELEKLKKNTEHSEEFKKLMESYCDVKEELDKENHRLGVYIDINNAVKNGKLKYGKVEEEVKDEWIWGLKNGGYYDKWLKKDNQIYKKQ